MAPDHRFSFSDALDRIKGGWCVARAGWNGKNMHIAAQYPDENSMNTLPYIYMITVTGDRIPWLASQNDLFAEDWYLVNL